MGGQEICSPDDISVHPGILEAPTSQVTLPCLPLELNGGLLLHGLTTAGRDTFFSYKKKKGLQLEGIEIGYAKASVHDQITQIKLVYDRISFCGAIMGYLN